MKTEFTNKVSVAIVAFVMIACGTGKNREKTVDSTPTVEVIQIRRLHPSLEVVLPGELKPWDKTEVFPRVRGYVSKVFVDRGTAVKKGQVLTELEAPELIASLNQARAQAASAEATLLERQARQRTSRKTYHRILQTSQTKGAVSANELEVAYAVMMSDSAMVSASEENLIAAKAQMAAQSQLASYLIVKAPFDGNVIERNISPGDLVGPDMNGKAMFILEDGAKLRLTIAVPENLANAVGEKSTVTFTTQAEPLKEYKAVFARSAGSVQESNRTMVAEFDFSNEKDRLKAGLYAEVRIPVRRSSPSFFVPKTSVLYSTEGVFLIKAENSAAEWVPVQKGNSLDSLVEIFGPVHEGEKIIKVAHDELRNGQPIKVK